jgi:hypothetical protein
MDVFMHESLFDKPSCMNEQSGRYQLIRMLMAEAEPTSSDRDEQAL